MDTAPSGFAIAQVACPVLESAAVGGRYHRLVVAAPGLAARTRPGQFCHLLCRDAGGNGPFLRRPMSVWRIGADGTLGFLLHVKGRGTAALARLRPGDTLDVVGPLGVGFSLPAGAQRVLVLARGVGLATLAPLVADGPEVHAVLSARAPEDLMAAAFGASSYDAVFDSDGTSAPEAVEALLRRRFETQRPDAVFTCGSNRLFLLLQRLAAEYGIPGQVALEQQMGCGLGMCFCCVRDIRDAAGKVTHQRVCREGPVFDLQQALAW
jgi:dihydroorotate dehydrogenase electron transfer subunit